MIEQIWDDATDELVKRWWRVWRVSGSGGPPVGLIDAPWWYVVGAELWAEELDRRAWLDELVERWGLVLMEER